MSGDWTKRPEGGGQLSLRLMAAIARHGGRRLARVLLLPITAYFLLMRAPERRASIDFLQRALGRRAGWADAARHIYTFAATILDRLFLLSGRTELFDTQVTGLPELHAALDQGRGMVLIGSHLGSFEVLRVLARERPQYTIRVVLDKSQSPMITQLLDELDPAMAAGIIDASMDGTSIVMAIKDACQSGAMVALLADRVRPGEPSVQAQFLGETTHFPVSPWLIASALQVPVVLAFGLYHGGNRYHLHFESFADTLTIERRQRQQQLAALIQRYATRLETMAQHAPYNWFNFYDFWTPPSRAQTPDAAQPATGSTQHGAGADRRP